MIARYGLIALLLLGACMQPKKNYVLKVKLQQLHPNNIYDEDLVYDVLFDAEEQDLDSLRKHSRQLFLEGIDQYKNKRNLTYAAMLLRKSVVVFPEAKTYYELGNVLSENAAGAAEALKAYRVAERLQFQPAANISYGQACAYSLLQDGEEDHGRSALYELQNALKQGFTDSVRLYTDKRLRKVVQSPEFRSFLVGWRAEKLQDKPQSLFTLYARTFPLVPQPFEIPLEKVEMKDYPQSISYDFARFIPEMQNTSFGREVSHDYFYVARVAETPQYTAVVYSSVSFYEEFLQPVMTKLVTYSPDGQLISSLLLSCQCSAEKVKKGRIDNNVITLEDYKRTWKQPIDKVPFEQNQVKEHELLATATFRIDEQGKIVELEVPADYSDTGLLAANLTTK